MSGSFDNSFRELCLILNNRNRINLERSKARYRYRYYINASYKVKEYNAIGANAYYQKNHDLVPSKWLKVGHSTLELRALKEYRKYTDAKIKTANFTKKYHHKAMKLLKKLNAALFWSNGYVVGLRLNKDCSSAGKPVAEFISSLTIEPGKTWLYVSKKEISKIANDYTLSKAIERAFVDQTRI